MWHRAPLRRNTLAAVPAFAPLSPRVASRRGRTGSAKTYTMNLGPRALGGATAASRNSKYTKVRQLASHIVVCKDGTTPTLLADDSAACARNPLACPAHHALLEPDLACRAPSRVSMLAWATSERPGGGT